MQIAQKWKFKQKGNAGIEKFDALCNVSKTNISVNTDMTETIKVMSVLKA